MPRKIVLRADGHVWHTWDETGPGSGRAERVQVGTLAVEHVTQQDTTQPCQTLLHPGCCSQPHHTVYDDERALDETNAQR